MLLDGIGRADEAWDHARQGLELEPGSPFTHNVCGALHEAHGRRDPARDAWRRAIELAVDTAYAIEKLTHTGETDAQRGEALAFIEGELRRQVVFGDGLFAYRRAARGILPPAAVWDRLQEALRARPDLWAAWSVAIQQAIDMDRLDEAAALAVTAGERFPYVAQLWRDRARLHQARLEAPEAMQALEAALLLQPAWSEAARELGELLERHHDLPRAQKVLELACAQAPMDAVNHGCLASVLWRAGRREEAITRLRHALRLQPGYVWAWSMLREWAQAEGQPELTLSLARDLAERRPGEARSWMVLAEQLGERLDPECLEAAARALALNPRGDQVYELQARLLVKLNRCEEALACCRPAILSPTPLRLRMCEAWIEAERGRLPAAIAAMEATLREAPANYEGWERLTQWLSQAGEPARAAETADHLAALAPHDPKPLAYAAFLRRQQGDSEGAVERYRRAFQLDPSYVFAGLSLADLLLERQELAEVGDVLATLRHTEAGAAVQLRDLQLALAMSNSTRALEIFEALCREPHGEAGCLFGANDALVQNGRDKAVRATIQRLLGEAQTSAWLGALWVKRRFFRGQYSINRVFQQLTGPGERGRNTLITYLNSLAGCYHAAAARRDLVGPWRMRRCLRALLATHRERLLEDDELWGATGYSLVTLGLYAQTVAWLETWPQRAKAQPWMLYNFALAAIVLKRPEPALAALRRGLEMRQDAELYGSLAAAAAFEEAMAGRGAAARELLASQEGRQLNAADLALAGLTRVRLAGAEASPVGAYRWAVQVREMVRDSFSGFRPCHHGALVRRGYFRCLQQASQRPGGWLVKVWGAWHYLGGAGWFMADVLVVSSPFLLCLPR